MFGKITSVLLFFVTVNMQAQKMIVGNENSAFSFSNSITNHLTDQMLMSRFLDKKDLEAKSLLSKNYFLAEINYSLFLTYYLTGAPDKESTGIHFSLSHRSLINALYTADAYHIIFEGNAGYADKTADLGGSSFQRLTYQTLEGGYFKAFESGNYLYYGYAGIGLVKGQRRDALSLDRFSLYTQPDGEYLDVNAKMNYAYCDEGKSPLSFNGAGAALHLKAMIKNKEKDWQLELEARDVGFIRWMNTAKQADFDSTFRFDGFPVSLLTSEVSDKVIGDTLSDLLQQHTTSYRKSTMIPSRFSIAFTKAINEKLTYTTGFYYYAFTSMRFPYTRFDIKYKLSQAVHLTALFRYGFYNNMNVGLAADFQVLSKMTVHLGILNLPAFVVPSMTSSQGLMFAVTYNL